MNRFTWTLSQHTALLSVIVALLVSLKCVFFVSATCPCCVFLRNRVSLEPSMHMPLLAPYTYACVLSSVSVFLVSAIYAQVLKH